MLTGIHDALIIHNPAAGQNHRRRARDLAEARSILAEAGIETEIADTTRPGDATRLAAEAAANDKGLVIACGGDGTINEVVNGLAGSHVPLAILPAGTANVLGKELELPWDIPEAARRIPSGRLARIALGLAVPGGSVPAKANAGRGDLAATSDDGRSASTEAGAIRQAGRRASPLSPKEPGPGGSGRYFISIAGAGVDGSMVYYVNSQLKQATGTLAYWLQGVTHFFSYDLVSFPVTIGDQTFQAAQVIVGRTRYFGGPFQITAGANLFSNRFEVAVFTAKNRFRYPWHMIEVWSSRLRGQKDVHIVSAEWVQCAAKPGAKIYAEIDGEPAGTLPTEFRIVPDALTLVVPENVTREAGSDVH